MYGPSSGGGPRGNGKWPLEFRSVLVERQQALARHEDIYASYVADRVTGFMGHWMTLGAAQMAALLLLLSVLVFAPRDATGDGWDRGSCNSRGVHCHQLDQEHGWPRWFRWCIWSLFGNPGIWLLAPLVFFVGWMIAPRAVRERVISIYRPRRTD